LNNNSEYKELIALIDKMARASLDPDIDICDFLDSVNSISSVCPDIFNIAWVVSESAMRTHESSCKTRLNQHCESSFVYLMKGCGTGTYKIGVTADIDSRVKAISTMSSGGVELICSGAGGSRLELELHRKYKSRRLHGEWFNLSGDDVEYIKVKLGLI